MTSLLVPLLPKMAVADRLVTVTTP